MTEKDIQKISEMYKNEKEPLYDKLKDVIPALIQSEYIKKKKHISIRKKNPRNK